MNFTKRTNLRFQESREIYYYNGATKGKLKKFVKSKLIINYEYFNGCIKNDCETADLSLPKTVSIIFR